jgi:hypothetical protein
MLHSHVNYLLFLSGFNQNGITWIDIPNNSQISSFMKTSPVGAVLFHADRRGDGRSDRRTDMTKPTVAFRNLANAPRIVAKFPNKLTTITRDFSFPQECK